MTGEQMYVAEGTERSLVRGYLLVSVGVSSAISLLAVIALVWALATSGKRHAYVVRIEPDGQTELVAEGFGYKRQPQEVKWFLERFCSGYFSRNRHMIQTFPETLLYFSPDLRGEVAGAWKAAKVIETAMSSQTQVNAVATQVQLSRDGNEAYVQIRLDRISNGQVADPKMCSTYIRFECLACEGKGVPDSIVSANPLGMLLTSVPTLEESK